MVIDGFRQTAAGVDVLVAAGRWPLRGELIQSRWTLPVTYDRALAGGVRATAGWIEGRLRVSPGVDLAARAERLGFSEVATPSAMQPWESPVSRLEAGFAAGRAVMDQRHETFVPRLLAVTTGTAVDFPNSDLTYHNVFSLSRARRFDLGRYAAGKSKAVRVDRPGIVRVFCDIHTHMSAFVVVFNHPYFRVTGVDGRYHIDNVPPGSDAIVGWYEGEARVQRTIPVAPGAATELDLVVP